MIARNNYYSNDRLSSMNLDELLDNFPAEKCEKIMMRFIRIGSLTLSEIVA
jgi:hypothetical protein